MFRWNAGLHREWLDTASRDDCMVISLRAVLRVFPLAMMPVTSGNRRDLEFAVQSFRFLFSGWTDAVHFGGERATTLSEQFRRPSDYTAAEPAGLAIQPLCRIGSLKTLSGVRAATVRVAELVEKAALLQGSSKATLQLWQSIGADVDLLSRSNISRLIGSRLWLNDVLEGENFRVNFPKWVRRPLDAFDKNSDIPDYWKIWLRWYRSLLSERPTAQSGELLREDVAAYLTTRMPEFWKRDPSDVMSQISLVAKHGPPPKEDAQTMKQFIVQLLEAHDRPFSIDEIEQEFLNARYFLTRPSIRGRINSLTYEGRIKRVARAAYASIKFNSPVIDIEPLPSQGPGPHFRATEDGVVDRAPASAIDSQGNDGALIDQLRPLALRYARELHARLSRNEFPELLSATEKYLSALDPLQGDKIEWGEVWGLGVVLQNAAASAQREIKNRTLPELEDPAKTALDSLLMIHGPLILASQDGAKLSQVASDFSMTREEQQVVAEAAKEIADHLAETPSIVTKRAAESVDGAAEAIGKGRHPERGAVYGLATIKNISIVLVGGAAAATPTIVGALLGGPVVGAVLGAPLSLLVVEAVKKNPAFTALVTQLGAKLETMTDLELRLWLEKKALQLAPFKSFVSNNKEHLIRIAESTPELGWMLKYIAFIDKDQQSH